MLTVNISTLKNQLSAILKKVRKGEEVLVVDREHPVARLAAVGGRIDASSEDLIVRDLEKKGVLERARARKKSAEWIRSRLVLAEGVSAVEALLKDREESR